MTADILSITMQGLDAGLRVRDIATFDVQSCRIQDSASEILSRSGLAGFDYLPVLEEERTLGVLERSGQVSDRPAGELMRPLDDSLLVSADEPLTSFLPELLHRPYWLVVSRTRIDGIVTRSDVQKLPVRLLAFTLITHLEMTMARVIVREMGDDAWLEKLSSGRRQKIKKKQAALQANHVDPPMVELAEFCDKRDVLAKLQALGVGRTREDSVGELKRVEGIRNTIAHAGEYGKDDDALKEFVERLEMARRWITELEQRLASEPQPSGGI